MTLAHLPTDWPFSATRWSISLPSPSFRDAPPNKQMQLTTGDCVAWPLRGLAADLQGVGRPATPPTMVNP